VDVPAPLPAGDVVSIRVDTDPSGGKLILDGKEVTGGTIVIGKADPTAHTLQASNACYEDQRAVRATDSDSIVIRLKTPKLSRIRVTSDPPGARVKVDGHEMTDPTPANLNLTSCEPHAFSVKLAGYKDAVHDYPANTVWANVSPLQFSMEKLPDGTVSVKAPYPVDVVEDGRTAGASGSPITLPAGKHTLTFVNKDLFVNVSAEVNVPAGGAVAPNPPFPSLGQLNVFANPSNGYVVIEGRKMGALPINGLQLAEGSYNIKVVLDTGETKEQTTLVTAGKTSTAKFIFR
jgi:hypothetical protein